MEENLNKEAVIELSHISMVFGGKKVLDDINLTVNKGDIYGFVGENGAGKTTVMRILTGLIKQTSGSYKILGASYDSKGIYKARSKVGAIIETPAIYTNFNAYDNLKLALILAGKKPEKSKIEQTLKNVGLESEINSKKKAGNFSLGMRQRLGIAMAAVDESELLILDEPINGLDPTGIVEIRNLILNLHKQGVTVFISSHILSELSMIATRYGIISHGKMVKEFEASELEKLGRKSTSIKTSDNQKAFEVVKEVVGADNVVLTDNTIDIYGEFNLNEIIKNLALVNIDIEDITKHSDSLEDVYLKQINGENQQENVGGEE